MNFAAAQPPLTWGDLAARDALEAYVSSAHQLPPRQAQAIARLAARWAQDGEGRNEGGRNEGGTPDSSLTPSSLTPFPSPED